MKSLSLTHLICRDLKLWYKPCRNSYYCTENNMLNEIR